ncbi:MAG: hypothetical protein ACRDPK_02030 [Carbonactinosporaceae bacterium]
MLASSVTEVSRPSSSSATVAFNDGLDVGIVGADVPVAHARGGSVDCTEGVEGGLL